MTEDKKQSDEITQAGAVELEENSLDQAAGGIGEELAWKLDPGAKKVDPIGNKYDPIGWKLDPGAIGHKIG